MKKLHSNTKIFFKNPIIAQLEQRVEPSNSYIEHNSFSKIRNKCLKQLCGTWGYSDPKLTRLSTVSNLDWILRSYWCFQDEQDLLIFNFISENKVKKVKIFPSETRFTIWEME